MSLLFRFRHSRSDELPWLIELAKRGQFRQQALSPKQIIYEAAFDLIDPVQLAVAISLSTALVHDKKAEAFVAGQSIGLSKVRAVLLCYQQSWQVEDPHAFCWFHTGFSLEQTIFEWTLGDGAPKPFIFPCHLAANAVAGLHPQNSGSLAGQTDAALLRAEVRWCPRLADLTDWREAQVIQIDRRTL